MEHKCFQSEPIVAVLNKGFYRIVVWEIDIANAFVRIRGDLKPFVVFQNPNALSKVPSS